MLTFDFSSLNVTLLLSVFLFLVHRYLSMHFNYWKDKGIIYKQPKLIFGSYKDFMLLKTSVGQIFNKIYNDFPNETVVGCFKGRKPELLIRDPEMIKCVLVKDFSIFPNRQEDSSDDIEKLNSNLFTVHGERWRAMRQKFTPAFTSGKLKNMFHLIVEKGEEFQNFLEDKIRERGEHEIRELMARFTTDVIGSIAFGVKMNSMADTNAPFRKMGKKIFQTSKSKTLKRFFRLFSPQLFNLLKLRVREKEIEDFFISTMKEIVDQRKEGHITRHDFIDLLLEIKEKGSLQSKENPDTQMEFTDVFMTAQAFIFFAAGFETSSTLMSFTLYELAKNPEVQQKVIAEIDCVLNKYDGKLSYEAISDMHYLECVISEAMRKYPALSVLNRVCNATYTFPGTKITLEKGICVVVPVYALHYDSKYYPEPEKFIPERFTAEATKERHPMVYLPFGEGPRNCIGQRFGKMQSMVGLVSLLARFRVEPSSKTEEKVIYDPMSLITIPKNGIHLSIKSRDKTI